MTSRWILTDTAKQVWLDAFEMDARDIPQSPARDCRISKRTLRGGLSDGIDFIELCNGPLTVRVLPTRGGGLWNADHNGIRLGWDAPVRGPVHPKFVDQDDRNGIGWLAGFDEWLCRCGLVSNGPPGDDGGKPLTLHGRIANSPAHFVEVGVSSEPPYYLYATCSIEEGGLFLGRLRLTSTVLTIPGSNRLTIRDVVENLASTPAEIQMLYHLNFGPPLLEAASKFAVPIREMAPLTARAAEDVDRYGTYLGPTPGYTEQVYAFRPAAQNNGETLALLCNAAGNRGASVTWNVNELPCFTLWKNTIPLEDGYVTGLEPGTNYPYFKTHERKQGRVPVIAAGGRWEATWHIDVLHSAAMVRSAQEAIARIQSQSPPVVHRTPVWGPG